MLSDRRFVPVCFVLYMAVRVAVLFVRPLEQTSDFLWYFDSARGLAAGAGYTDQGALTAFWPVGWPAVLGMLFRIFGSEALVGQIANLAFSAAAFWLTVVFGTAAFRSPLAARAAVLLLTLYPNQIGYVPLLSTELFFEALLLGGVLLLLRERAVLAGLVFGLAALTKSQAILIPAVLLVSALPFARALRLGAVVYVVALLVIVPWTWRNHEVFHAFIPVSSNGGWTLLTGNNPQASGGYTPDTVLAAGITHDPAQQVAMDHLARSRAVAWIEANPSRFLRLLPKKVFHLWAPDGESEWFYQRGYAGYDAHVLFFRALRVLNQAYYVVLLLLAVPAMWLVPRREAWAASGVALMVYTTLVSIVFSGQSRFHASLMPFIALYAGWTLVRFSSSPQARPTC
jgi:hypothetical protein